MSTKAARIALLNDRLRQTWSLRVYGVTHLTEGFRGLPPGLRSEFIEALETFDDFRDKENDPYGEHDFGAITIEGVKVFWKIDYFAKPAPGEERYTWGSEHPEDPRVTDRVLTAMLASEY